MSTYRKPDLNALQAQCDAFNFDCREGGRVAVKLDGSDKPFITSTRSRAQVLSGHSAVVWLNDVSGCYLLDRVTPIPDSAEAWAVFADNGNVRIWSRDRAACERIAAESGRPVVPYTPPSPGAGEWLAVTGFGQVAVGDTVRFTIGDKAYRERVALILNPGTELEEVIYDRRKNFYFITNMVLTGSSNHKGVEFRREGTAA